MSMTKIKDFLWREWKTIFRFLMVGGSSFAVKAVSYALLSRLIWTSGSRNVENGIALVVATIYNYLLHRFWTFGHQRPASGVIKRYSIVLALGTAMDIGFFYILHSLWHIYDFLALAMTSLLIAFCTFNLHRFWTFHEKPWRRRG